MEANKENIREEKPISSKRKKAVIVIGKVNYKDCLRNRTSISYIDNGESVSSFFDGLYDGEVRLEKEDKSIRIAGK